MHAPVRERGTKRYIFASNGWISMEIVLLIDVALTLGTVTNSTPI